jgi:hypothetical protein
MIEEFLQALARLKAYRKSQNWREAQKTIDEEFKRLMGAGPQAAAQFTETELLARLIQGEPTLVVRQKAFMLVSLWQEAGDLATAQGRLEEGRAAYLKGLHVMLEILSQGQVSELPEFVPKVESILIALKDTPLTPRTLAMLMRHYEQTGQFGRAEDALFAMLELEPQEPRLIEFGMAFYERISRQPDFSLQNGNLHRAELDAGLAELRQMIGAAQPNQKIG